MKLNENIVLVGQRVILVPYRKEHVQKYHEWMSEPELRELTASELLSLEEEYEMQQKWQEDEDKLTFIVLWRDAFADSQTQKETPNKRLSTNTHMAEDFDQSRMIGDVNLFLKGSHEDEDFEVEAEIMIAEKAHRRNGCASEALQILLSFATSYKSSPTFPVSVSKVVVRIGYSNSASIQLFKKLGFVVTKHVEVFQELEMRLQNISAVDSWMKGEIMQYEQASE